MEALSARIKGAAAAADAALSFLEVAFIGLAIAFASLLLFANVVLRYVFLAPISWAEELSIYLIIWIVFVGGSVLIRTGGHIAVDLLPLALTPPLRRQLQILVLGLALVFFAAFFYYGGIHTLRVRSAGQLTPIMLAPMWLTYLAMPFGSLLMFLRTSQNLWRVFRGDEDRQAGGAIALD